MEPGWDDEPAPRRRSPLTAVVAVLLVLALVGGAVVIAFDRTDEADGGSVEGDDGVGLIPPAQDLPPPSPTELEAVVEELSAFVAGARELAFEQDVPVTLLDDAAFTARVQEDAIEDLAEIEETEAVLRALGLFGADVNLADSVATLLGQGVVGFYDAETGELVVRGAALTPYVRITLVHELTHALDDQHFELHRPVLDDADDETGLAFAALVEGNAARIESEYRATLSEDEREQADAEERRLGGGIDLSGVPRVLPALIGFPYAFGPAMVDAIVADGGEGAVDAAYREPPLTSEQVLDPGSWLDGAAEPVPVPPPAAGGEVFDEGVLGLWGIVLVLETEMGQRDAIEAARGWGGDWYVAWRAGDETCVRSRLVMDTEADLRELASALDVWAAGQDDAEVDRAADAVTITSCG